MNRPQHFARALLHSVRSYVIFERDLYVMLAAALATGVLASIALMILVLLLSKPAQADDEVTLGEVHEGSLLFKTETPGRYRVAPMLGTEVALRVAGLVARATVKQRFANITDSWVEGVYVFPLPENAAVDHLKMHVGARIIEGQIKERGEAKRVYEQAKQDGKKASLIEQQRPNMFTTSVANIAPRDEITIEIEVQQTLRYDQGTFFLRFPLAITPRYIPGEPEFAHDCGDPVDAEFPSSPLLTTKLPGLGWSPNTDQVPDASHITPITLPDHVKSNPVNLTVELNAGFALQQINSTTHVVTISHTGPGNATITLADGAVPASRDFELTWTPQPGSAPRATVFTQEHDGAFYHLLMVLPPSDELADTVYTPREVIFIIDTSGSMAGTSIEQAKRALLMALDRLRPTDRFNVIEFNSITNPLFDAAYYADADHVRKAKRFVEHLSANGGTEIAGALRAALDGREKHDLLRQVVFLTDGSVGNEEALFDMIRTRLGDSRLFTIGIGSAPNSYFMKKAAEFGHGTFTYIGDVNEVSARMTALFTKLENPALQNLALIWPTDAQVETWPRQLPDLYEGEPLVVTARSNKFDGDLVVTGKRGAGRWHTTLPLHDAQAHTGIDVAWARAKIEFLMDVGVSGGDAGLVRKNIIDVALRHHLVSKYTSLVAVDVTPSRPLDELVRTGAVPGNLPDGQITQKIFGTLPQTATPGALYLVIGTMLLMLALWLRVRGVRCAHDAGHRAHGARYVRVVDNKC